MSKSHFSLSNFQAQVATSALARTNRFEVIITPPKIAQRKDNSELASLFCEVSNLPPLNINVKAFKIYGPNHQRPIGSDYGGDGLSMTFHLDSGMTIKRFFDDWMEGIVTRDTYNVNYQDNYATSILLRQLRPSAGPNSIDGSNENNNNSQTFPLQSNPFEDKDDVMYEIELIEAFPRSMNIVEFNNSAQNQTQRLTVVFAYRYWRRTDIKKFVQPVLTPDVIRSLPQVQVNATQIRTDPEPITTNPMGDFDPSSFSGSAIR
jgi:hypothetical protein